MHFDDRLATVLRIRATGERAARTQFRQLIDLLGERPQAGDPALKAAAYLRLIALGEMIEPKQRAAIVGEHGWRFRNPELVKWFGEAHPYVAAAALYRAQLSGHEWAELIPKLPIRARGFLRHRKDLPPEAVAVLDQLGVSDRALPEPEILDLMDELAAAPQEADPERPSPSPVPPGKDDVRTLVERIESRRLGRAVDANEKAAPAPAEAPKPPTPSAPATPSAPPLPSRVERFKFVADYDGKIEWADRTMAPMVVGTDLAKLGSTALRNAMSGRQPVRDLSIALRGAEAIAGDWLLDANPRFTTDSGRFTGYHGRFRRAPDVEADNRAAHADRLRQLLHELRTPVNAMQGYAEIIQQQMIGPVPHEYRSIAATIAGDAAHILAGFDELDRLAKLEAGVMELDAGEADFAAILRKQVSQVQTVLAPRVARFDAQLGDASAPVAIDTGEAEMLAWRLLATIAGATGAGEAVELRLETQAEQAEFAAALPNLLREADDIFAVEIRPATGSLSAGIFGAGFSLRLARAEARATGGDLMRDGDRLVLSLPLLTAVTAEPVPENAAG